MAFPHTEDAIIQPRQQRDGKGTEKVTQSKWPRGRFASLSIPAGHTAAPVDRPVAARSLP